MSDTFSQSQRSHIMRQVKSSRNKSTELKLIKILKANSITGWRRNYKLFGKPDFVLPKQKIAIFLDGCFWHGHNCRNTKPSDNKEYWTNKIAKNIQRDKIVTITLTQKRWRVIRIWECKLKDQDYIVNLLKGST